MNMPSFTADASLYGERGHYRMAGAHTWADAAIRADGAIQPQQGATACEWASYPDGCKGATCDPGKTCVDLKDWSKCGCWDTSALPEEGDCAYVTSPEGSVTVCCVVDTPQGLETICTGIA
jgi:hypothetical protein